MENACGLLGWWRRWRLPSVAGPATTPATTSHVSFGATPTLLYVSKLFVQSMKTALKKIRQLIHALLQRPDGSTKLKVLTDWSDVQKNNDQMLLFPNPLFFISVIPNENSYHTIEGQYFKNYFHWLNSLKDLIAEQVQIHTKGKTKNNNFKNCFQFFTCIFIHTLICLWWIRAFNEYEVRMSFINSYWSQFLIIYLMTWLKYFERNKN